MIWKGGGISWLRREGRKRLKSCKRVAWGTKLSPLPTTREKLSVFLTEKQVCLFMEIAKDISMIWAIPYDVACDRLYVALFQWPLPRVPWWKRLISKGEKTWQKMTRHWQK